jgi:N utilization substance protein B
VGVRRKARECALQLLFAQERGAMRPEALEAFWDDAGAPPLAREYAEQLVALVAEHTPQVDNVIARYAENWTLDRMSRVDRNLLRIAVCELLFVSDVPVRVALDEAIEIAKRFGGDDSGRFVNGILDRIAREEAGATAEDTAEDPASMRPAGA